MVKSPKENGSGTTAADCTAPTDRTAGRPMGEPAIVAGPGFELAGLV